MKEKSVFAKSSAAVCALFVLGNGVIVLPTSHADEYTFLEFLAAAVISCVSVGFFLPLSQKIINCEKKNLFIKILSGIFWAVIAVSAMFFAADTFSDFSVFISEAVLRNTPFWIIAAVFFGVAVYFSLKRQEHILKFALVAVSLSVFAVLFFFLAKISDFELRNIFIFRLPQTDKFISGIIPYFKKAVLPALLLPFYNAFVLGEKKGGCVRGTVLGYALLGICLLNSILLFSPSLAGRLSFPYSSAVSTVTVGKLFTRMDGFSYFLYFASGIIKISVCVFVAFSAMKETAKMCRGSAVKR